MKKLWISIVGLILLLAVTPLIIGLYLQKQYQPNLAALMESSNLNFKLRSYHRGWFSSEATWIMNLPLIDKPLQPEVNNPDDALTISQKIYHGPLIINRHGVTVALLEIISKYNQTFLANSTLTLLGNLKTHIAVPSLTVPQHSSMPMYSISNAYGNLDWNLKNNKVQIVLKLQHLSSKTDRSRTIDNFSVLSNLSKTHGGLWIGKREYQVGRMVWEQDSKQYYIKQLNFNIITAANDGRYNMVILGSVANLGIDKNNYGSQQIKFSMNNLNLSSVEQFHAQFPITAVHLLNPNQWQAAKEKFVAMLHQGAEIKLDSLQLNTFWGTMAATGHYHSSPKTHDSLEVLQKATISAKIPSDLLNQLLTGLYQLKLRSNDENVISNEIARTLVAWQQQGWLMLSNNQALINYQWQTKEK